MRYRPSPVLVASPVILAFLQVGCGDPEPPPEMEAEIAELRAERETLVAELEEAHRQIGALRDEISRIELPDAFLARLEAEPRTAGDSLRALVQRAREADRALVEAESRAAVFRQRVDSVQAVHEETVSDYEARLGEQADRVRGLEGEVEELAAGRTELDSEVRRLERRLADLQGDLSLGYHVVGTRAELLERGVVREEGGARILGFLWKRGETLVPARETDPGQFEAIDLREERAIPLPDPEARYRIVSRHDPAHFGPDVGPDGTFRGDRLEVVDPEGFLAQSRFLIVVQAGG